MFILTKATLLTHITALVGNLLIPSKGFSQRVKKRNRIFWKSSDAVIVRNTIMNANDTMEKWKDVKNWQRKLSNKYNSREFARKHGCRVPELYWKGNNYTAIDFDNLPEHYVIRPTKGHSLKLVFLIKNSINLMDGKKYSKEDIKVVLSKALYDDQKIEFLFEEFVRTEDGEYKIPDDYKFYMFNGQIGCIQVINRLSNTTGFTSWYDENWNLLPNLTTNYPEGKVQPIPKCLQEMIDYAGKLSKSYEIFVRVDFYATDKGAVFGEFTPTPGLGNGFTADGEKLLTEYWEKFCYGRI